MASPRIEQLKNALIAADNAGNTEDAQVLANEIRRLQALESSQQSTTAEEVERQFQAEEDARREERDRQLREQDATRREEQFVLLEERDGEKLYQNKVTGEKSLVTDRFSTSDPRQIEQWERGRFRAPAGPQAGAMAAGQAMYEEAPAGVGGLQFFSGVPYIGEYGEEIIGQTPFEQQAMREARRAFEAERPGVATGTKLAGLATGLVGEAAALGPALLPRGATIQQQIASGALRVGGISALEGLLSGIGRGETPEERQALGLSGMGIGGLVGTIAGGILPVAGEGFRFVMSKFKGSTDRSIANKLGISKNAAGALREALENDDFDAAMAAVLRAGDQTMLADASEAFQNILDMAVQEGGRAGRIGTEAVRQRAQKANEAFQGYLDKVLGQPTGRLAIKREIMSESEAARRTLYDAAYAVPINYNTPMGEQLKGLLNRVPESVINRAQTLMRLRGESSAAIDFTVRNDGTIDFVTMPDVRQIDYIKRALQDMSRRTRREGEDILSQSYDQLARGLRDTVSQENPAYATALQKAGDVIQDREAVDIGYDLIRRGPASTRISREAAEQALENASESELRAARRGLRIGIDDDLADISRTATDPNTDVRELHRIMRDMTSRSAKEKMELLLGKEGAEELAGELDQALTALRLSAAIARNSKTAARQAVQRGAERATSPGIGLQLILDGFGSKEGGLPLVSSARTLLEAFTGFSPEARHIRKLGFYSDIADVLTRTGDRQAEQYLNIITNAITEGRRLQPSEAEIVAGYLVKRSGAILANEGVFESVQATPGPSQPAPNQDLRQGAPQ